MIALTVPRSLPGPSTTEDDEPSLKVPVVAGSLAMVAFLGGFLGWSMFAKLDSAVVASGAIVVDSHRKTIQHLEGGILRELRVYEGQQVRAGDILAVLDMTQADAQVGQLENQDLAAQARLARLRAEQAGDRRLVFSEALTRHGGHAIASEAMRTQGQLFEARWLAHDSAVAMAEKRIEQLRAQIATSQERLASVRRRLALAEEERSGAAYLVQKGYERRVRLLELERQVEELKEQESEHLGSTAEARKAIAGAELEIANLKHTRQAEIAQELEEVRALHTDLTEQIRAARDVRQRHEIVAPQDGVVVDLRLVTPGGVLTPGEPLLDIVPVDDNLIVEARVHPNDIEVVHVGLPARVQMIGFKNSTTPPLDGSVTYVSADMLSDQRTGQPYFVARVTLSEHQAAPSLQSSLSPGMPAEVFVVTGERRAIDYLAAPLRQRMRRAFRED